MIKKSLKTGVSFGLTSGVITTLGLIVGLHSGTHSKLVIIGGIVTIAIADSFSDALGIHISEEAKNETTTKEIWEATISTFVTKFIFAMIFVIPVLLLPLIMAIVVSVLFGMFLLGVFSFYIAKEQKVPAWRVILEHLFIAVSVICITHFVGEWVGYTFA